MKEKVKQQERELNASNPRVFMEAQSATKQEVIRALPLWIYFLFVFIGGNVLFLETIFISTLALRVQRAHLESLCCLQCIRKECLHVTIEQNKKQTQSIGS